MALIDTLKLARALRDRGGFSEQAAEATAEAINAALGERMASKADLDQAVERLEHRIDETVERLEHRINETVERLEHRINEAVERLEHRIEQGIGGVDNRLDRAVDKLTARLNFMQWQIGIIAALQIATLVKLFVH